MQDREESNPGSKMFRVGRNFQESFGDRTEQQVVQLDFILQDQTVQLMRQREHDMEVTGKCCRQHLPVYVLVADMCCSRLAPRLEAHAVDFETT
jgi:hypothetical protein